MDGGVVSRLTLQLRIELHFSPSKPLLGARTFLSARVARAKLDLFVSAAREWNGRTGMSALPEERERLLSCGHANFAQRCLWETVSVFARKSLWLYRLRSSKI